MIRITEVSVIIPLYNAEKYIGRCLRSILSQSLDRSLYEIIVINDGSNDNSLKMLNVFEDEITLINSANNEGLPASLNKGILKAKSKYLVRLDADDYVHEDYLKILLIAMNSNHKIDSFCCDYYIVNDKEEVIETKNSLTEPIGCGVIFRMEHLINIGLYDDKMRLNEERELMSRFIKKYNIERIPIPLYRYRRHQTNITLNKDQVQKYNAILKEKSNENI
ncbi:glycosyltransferase [Flavobacteriaceae bacterium]|nr:glycosyltransferase [Flavobacteriaceae bacterium]